MSSDRRTRLALLLSGLRWRAGSSLCMFVVSVFGVGIGAFGPIYLHSADQSILNATLRDAPPGNAGLMLSAAPGNGPPHLVAASADVPRPGAAPRWFGPPIAEEDAGVTMVAGNQPYGANLVARTGVCGQLSLVAGSCARAPGTVMVSARSAQLLGIGLGQKLAVGFVDSRRSASFVVAGLYRPGNPAAPYWWGETVFLFGSGSPSRPTLDDIFATAATVRASAPSALITSTLQFPFVQGTLAVDDAQSVAASVQRAETKALVNDRVLIATQLTALLSQATATEHTTTTIVAVVDLQLVLLALFVLYFVSSRTAQEREPDVRLAELRGFRPRSVLAVALAEPVAIVIAAVPVGLVVAWLVNWSDASGLFGPGIGASVSLLACVAAIATGVVGIVATGIGTRSMFGGRPQGATPGPGASGARTSTWSVAAGVASVSVAGAAFTELLLAGVSGTSGSSHADPLAAFAPGLLALALGVIGAWLLPVILRSTLGWSAESSKVAWALALRRVACRREFAAQIMLVTLAVSLGVFAVSGWAIAARNRTIRSQFDVGASKVLTVSVRPGVDFLSAVRGADPSGRSAMAVVVENADDGVTLAVDSTRMGPVMSWPPGLGAGGVAQVARHLIPAHLAPPVEVSGTALAATVDATFDAQPAPQLSATLFDVGFQTSQQVGLGTLVPGTNTYQASLAGVCPSGCTLVNLALTWAPSIDPLVPTGSADLDISSLAQRTPAGSWEPIGAGLTQVGRWTSGMSAARLAPTATGLRAVVNLNPFGVPVDMAPADVPGELPAVVTPTIVSVNGGQAGALSLVGLDGTTVPGHPIGEVSALPRVGGNATLVALQMAERFLSGPFVDDATEVWLAPGAPGSIETRLAQAGVSVIGIDSTSARQNSLVHGGVSLAYRLFLIAAVAAAALAVGGAGFALVAGSRRRQEELAALRAVGIGAAALRRAVMAEHVLVLGTGLLFGAGAGMVAADVALRSVPEFVALGLGPPLDLALPAVLLGICLAGLVIVLGATVRVGASAVVRGATADKLGGARL